MNILGEPTCINLSIREDRRLEMALQAEERDFNICWYITEKDTENPVRGCWNSHLAIIRKACAENKDWIYILEDDAVFKKSTSKLSVLDSDLPSDWALLYLGGTIKKKKEYSDKFDRAVEVLSTHAYVINKSIFSLFPKKPPTGIAIDTWIVENIQNKYPCYILKNPITYQRDGFSDIENRFTRDPQLNFEPNYRYVEHEMAGDGEFIIPRPQNEELPTVSIVVPVRANSPFGAIMAFNYTNTIYPEELIEWVFVDSSETRDSDAQNFLPEADNIKYIYVKSNKSISEKRNIGCEASTGNIILHVDDDDIYSEFHALSRVRCLMSASETKCVGATTIPCLDIYSLHGYIRGEESNTIMEASMGYTKEFWHQQKFDNGVERGEGLLYLNNRRHCEIRQMPHVFIFHATLTHECNITGSDRIVSGMTTASRDKQLYNNLPEEVKILLSSLE